MRCPHCEFENPPGYTFCGQCGRPLPPATPPLSVGERRLVTVIFARVPGLPALPGEVEPEEAYWLVSSCIEALSAPVYRYGGTVDKIVNQDLMAVFGAPGSHEDDPARALWAARGMIKALERFNADNQARLPYPLTIQCGVNTGLVFAGKVGAPGLRTFTVIGDAVNLASRLAALADSGYIFVGESTYRQARRFFSFRPLPPLTVRGKSEPVSAFILTGAQAGEGKSELSSPLVGRQDELAHFHDRLRWLLTGHGGILLVAGDAGMGKSRLVAEARSDFQTLRWLEGHSMSFQADQPYSLFRDLIKRYLDLDEGTPVDEAHRRLQEMVARFIPHDDQGSHSLLAHLLGLPSDEQDSAVLTPLSGAGLQSALSQAVWAFLRGLAADQPTVIVTEDLQWADKSSLAMLTRMMVDLGGEVPVLFVPVLRPEAGEVLEQVRASQKGDDSYTEIWLSALSPQESATLVSHLLDTDVVPPSLQRVVLEKGEGNPLFITEVVRALTQDGTLMRREGKWAMRGGSIPVRIPDSLRVLLVSRVDRLEPETRETLRRAAVIGRIFPERVLAAVSDEGEELDVHLRSLLEHNFLHYYRLEGEEGRAFIFSNNLTHEATYEGILRDERQQLHRRTLEAMEHLYRGRLEAHLEELARHAYLGEVWDKAVHYLHLAGDRAKGMSALPEAVRHYQQAIGLTREFGIQVGKEQIADLYHECCSALVQLGNHEVARVLCGAFMELGERENDPYLIGHAHHAASILAAHGGDTVAQVNSARAACDALAAAGADWSRGTALFLLALGLFKSGQLDEAGAAIQEGLRLVGDVRRWPGYDPRGEALYYAGMIALIKGELEEAASTLQEASKRAYASGEQTFVATSLSFLGLAHGFQGAYKLGIQEAEEGVTVGEKARLLVVTDLCSTCAAWVHALAGHCGEAIRQAAPVLERRGTSTDARAIAHVALGDVYLGLLDPERGLAHYQKALNVAGLGHITTASAMRGIGLAFVLRGQTEQGVTSLSNSLAASTGFGLGWFRAQALRDAARAFLLLGQAERAGEHAAQLVAAAERADYRSLLGWGFLLQGQATGDSSLVHHGLEVGQELGDLLLCWEAGEALAQMTGDRAPLALARDAVQEIAANLDAETRAEFVGRPRARALLNVVP